MNAARAGDACSSSDISCSGTASAANPPSDVSWQWRHEKYVTNGVNAASAGSAPMGLWPSISPSSSGRWNSATTPGAVPEKSKGWEGGGRRRKEGGENRRREK